MIGVKSLAVLVLAILTVVVTVEIGALGSDHLAHLSAGAAFAIGVFASLCAALMSFSGRPGLASKVALTVTRGRPVLVFDLDRTARVREIPAGIQRGLFVLVFACLGVATFGGEAIARMASVPDDLMKPSRAEYCLPAEGKTIVEEAPLAPAPPPVDQAGCALVKRAFALGYAKTLGSCAPKTAKVVVALKATKVVEEVCERRQLDEPFMHYAYRKVVDTAAGASPTDAASSMVGELRTRFGYTRDLVADVRHSVTGTPHASHHVFVDLPDPHPTSFLAHAVAGEVPCATRFADLPLWPTWAADTSPSVVVEHVFGQLLFAARFGTTASCSDYTIHWDAPSDACTQLAADPAGFLDEHDAIDPIRDVLDRRRRQRAMRTLAYELGHEPTLPEPPPARAVASVACLHVKGSAGTGRPGLESRGKELSIEGETLASREVIVDRIDPDGPGPFDAYAALAELLGGTRAPRAATTADPTAREPATEPSDPQFLLLQLEPLVDADPIATPAARALLVRPDVREVYPIAQHLAAFIDGFRRVYLPQRGRL